MKKLVLLLTISPLLCVSQTDTSLSLNKKIISINEKGIDRLIEKYENILKAKNGVDGWRVQLKFKAKETEILQIKLKFIQMNIKLC